MISQLQFISNCFSKQQFLTPYFPKPYTKKCKKSKDYRNDIEQWLNRITTYISIKRTQNYALLILPVTINTGGNLEVAQQIKAAINSPAGIIVMGVLVVIFGYGVYKLYNKRKVTGRVKRLGKLTSYERDDKEYLEILEFIREYGNKSQVKFLSEQTRIVSDLRCVKIFETLEELGASKKQLLKVFTNISYRALIESGMSVDEIFEKIEKYSKKGENFHQLFNIFFSFMLMNDGYYSADKSKVITFLNEWFGREKIVSEILEKWKQRFDDSRAGYFDVLDAVCEEGDPDIINWGLNLLSSIDIKVSLLKRLTFLLIKMGVTHQDIINEYLKVSPEVRSVYKAYDYIEPDHDGESYYEAGSKIVGQEQARNALEFFEQYAKKDDQKIVDWLFKHMNNNELSDDIEKALKNFKVQSKEKRLLETYLLASDNFSIIKAMKEIPKLARKDDQDVVRWYLKWLQNSLNFSVQSRNGLDQFDITEKQLIKYYEEGYHGWASDYILERLIKSHFREYYENTGAQRWGYKQEKTIEKVPLTDSTASFFKKFVTGKAFNESFANDNGVSAETMDKLYRFIWDFNIITKNMSDEELKELLTNNWVNEQLEYECFEDFVALSNSLVKRDVDSQVVYEAAKRELAFREENQ